MQHTARWKQSQWQHCTGRKQRSTDAAGRIKFLVDGYIGQMSKIDGKLDYEQLIIFEVFIYILFWFVCPTNIYKCSCLKKLAYIIERKSLNFFNVKILLVHK